MYEQGVARKQLCRQASVEQDPVKFLNLPMKIPPFLSRKQRRLDAEYEEAEKRRSQMRSPVETASSGDWPNIPMLGNSCIVEGGPAATV
jgi:hypothetical protein